MSDENPLTTKSERLALARIRALLREIGPYAAIELILPGGSLIALLIWLCRRNDVARSVIRACAAAITRIAERPRAARLRFHRSAAQSPTCA